ncbi:hypothetical protein SCWH03_52280 [Streptomyces pacificus]|uniref:Uncharacterized protein n=1 Tax=Streptomyces pacificus TaxID=2705029 RepID=A0A6A0B3R9_9ACTN|nr:hypothetical protein SCWH03_52280 [Streptomyces pacificus]
MGGGGALVITHQATAVHQPGERALDNPTSRDHHEAGSVVAAAGHPDLHAEGVQGPIHQGARIAAVGPHQTHPREKGTHPFQEGHTRVAVLQVRGGDHHHQQQTQTVHGDVTLGTRHLLRPVVPAPLPGQGGGAAQGLGIDDRRTRLGIVPPFHDAYLLPQPLVQHVQELVRVPAMLECADGRPGREVGRHRPPLDAVVDEVPHRIDHFAVAETLRVAPAATQPARHRHHPPDDLPFLVRQIGRVDAGPQRPVTGIAVQVSETVTLRGEPQVGQRTIGQDDGSVLHDGALFLAWLA